MTTEAAENLIEFWRQCSLEGGALCHPDDMQFSGRNWPTREGLHSRSLSVATVSERMKLSFISLCTRFHLRVI